VELEVELPPEAFGLVAALDVMMGVVGSGVILLKVTTRATVAAGAPPVWPVPGELVSWVF
jgi:hypothetical protein